LRVTLEPASGERERVSATATLARINDGGRTQRRAADDSDRVDRDGDLLRRAQAASRRRGGVSSEEESEENEEQARERAHRRRGVAASIGVTSRAATSRGAKCSASRAFVRGPDPREVRAEIVCCLYATERRRAFHSYYQ
jgi:hypothetical protein